MAEALYERGTIETISRPKLAKACGIDPNALKFACREGRLSPAMEGQLVETVGFDAGDPSWIDTSIASTKRLSRESKAYDRRDTAVKFRDVLRKQLGLPVLPSSIRLDPDRPLHADPNLIYFSVDGSRQENPLGEPTPLFFCIVVGTGYDVSGLAYGFRRVRLRLEFDQQSDARIQKRLGQATRIEINRALLVARGTEFHSEWFLEAEQSVLHGEYATKEFALCVVEGAEPGEEFVAEVSVCPVDGSLLGTDGLPLVDPYKRRVIAHLFSLKLPGARDSQGWISLGRQQLRIVRAIRP